MIHESGDLFGRWVHKFTSHGEGKYQLIRLIIKLPPPLNGGTGVLFFNVILLSEGKVVVDGHKKEVFPRVLHGFEKYGVPQDILRLKRP